MMMGQRTERQTAQTMERGHAVEGYLRLLETAQGRAARYEAIFEQCVDSIALFGVDGSLIDFNESAHRNLGYTREEFQELHLSDIDALESADEAKGHAERVLREGSDRFETKHRAKDGQERDTVVRARLVSIGEESFIVSVWHDITDERKNIALQEVLEQVTLAKKEMGRSIQDNLEKIVLPMLSEFRAGLTPLQQKRLAALEESLLEITLPFAGRPNGKIYCLTPLELRICRLLRGGMSTKQIASHQGIAPATARKHRENIRRKLGLTGNGVNLVTFLNSILDGQAEGPSAPAPIG